MSAFILVTLIQLVYWIGINLSFPHNTTTCRLYILAAITRLIMVVL